MVPTGSTRSQWVKALCLQAWPEFYHQSLCSGRREPTQKLSSDLYLCHAPTPHTHTCSCTLANNQNGSAFKICLKLRSIYHCLSTCVCVCVCAHMCRCAHVWKPRIDILTSGLSLSPLFIETESLAEAGACQSSVSPHRPSCYTGSRCAWQVLYPLSHLFSPHSLRCRGIILVRAQKPCIARRGGARL